MDAVLKNLKLVFCTKGHDCKTPHCPFKHPWDEEPATAKPTQQPQQTQPPAADLQLRGGLQADEDGPRKRRKLASDPASAQPPQPTLPLEKPLSSEKPISPPPLKRKLPPGPNPPDRTPSPAGTLTRPISGCDSPAPASGRTATSKTSTPATRPTPDHGPAASSSPARSGNSTASSTPQKPTTTRKPEALNPRHLKMAAPAPHDYRYKVLKALHDQFKRLNDELKKDANDEEKKLVLSDQELIWLALDEEQRVATGKPSVYKNVILNLVMKYKRMTPGEWKKERHAEKKKEDARMRESNSTPTPKKPVLGPPKVIDTGLTPQQEVALLKFLLTPISELAKFGYIPVQPSEEEVKKARDGEAASLGWEVCDRCTTRFQVFPGRRPEDGALTSGGKCVHHPGRPYYPDRPAGSTDKPQRRYRCCNQVVGESAGCVTGNTHVFKTSSPGRLAALIPFAETPANPAVPKDRAVCFDCEMCYTVRGLELLRLTATSWPDGKELLDVLVHPVGEILDLNSRYSGVWPEDIINAEPYKPETADSNNNNVETTNDTATPSETTDSSEPRSKAPRKRMKIVDSPVAARELLFSLLSPETPLIGHGLENDLNAVRIVHPTLIDTVLLFPHKRGLPMRYGLKMLMETKLNRAIQVEDQEDDPTGHDSAEDARAAGELVRLKVMEKWKEMKAEGWTVVGNRFVPPGEGLEGLEDGEVALTEKVMGQA
ncbi:hypothetical protein VTJ04DRAFT_8244 [Mycothermus thermophilus]|uniref:uncharacterized protein n=1 Tax=Humicola insolens TaxID=85995 RepID=UPI00374475A4